MGSEKVNAKSNEGNNKVANVEAAEQASKEKHSKDPFYGLSDYAKKIQGLKEVFTKTKAAHERCDKTIASSEKSDKWEVSHWSAELDSLKAQCAEAQKSEEKDQKAFTFAVCEAAHNEIASVAESIEDSGDDEEL